MSRSDAVQGGWLAKFADELRGPQAAPERLALAIAAMAYPELDMQRCLADVDHLAAAVRSAIGDIEAGEPRARRFLEVLTDDLGFHGNHEEYYDPRNSFLNDVLDRRVGLPILLSVLCMAIGRRLDIRIDGMGFPGHFMVRYVDPTGAWLLDPFHGQLLEDAAAGDYLKKLYGRPVALPAVGLEPVTMRALAQRMLANLRGVYLNEGNTVMAARVLDYFLVLAPNDADLWQERGVLHHQMGEWDRSVRDLRRYFFLTGQLAATLSASDSGETLRRKERELLTILQESEQLRGLWN
jgi:regulator of sirC expression with transglutaminase-like and TPR domain